MLRIRQLTLAHGPHAAQPTTTAQLLAHSKALLTLARYAAPAEQDAALCFILTSNRNWGPLALGSPKWREQHAFPREILCGDEAQLRATLATIYADAPA